MWRNKEYLAKIREALEEMDGICQRCILRFGGCKSKHLLTKCTNSEEADLGAPPAKKAKPVDSGFLCRACCGVLQDSYMEKILGEVCDEIKACEYDSDHFTVAVSLPVSLTLRNRALEVYLGERVKGFDEDEVPPIKQVWKWLFPHSIERKLDKRLVTGDDCQFYAELQLESSTDAEELKALRSMCEKEYAKRAKNHKKYHMGLVTRVGAEKSLGDVDDELFKLHYPVPPSVPPSEMTYKLKMYHNSIFVAGRYNKFSRTLPQTPWILEGKRVLESSVEELILDPLKAAVKFDSAKFCSSGREDVDVRMLGNGRPFVYEIVNPRKVNFTEEEMLAVQRNINKGTNVIFVRDLQVVPKNSVKHLKEGEDTKTKRYEALCVYPLEDSDSVVEIVNNLEALRDQSCLELSQRTPVRVLHRRPNLTRKRSIYTVAASPIRQEEAALRKQKHLFFKLDLSTQAGTYVKEFVHGDFGRTFPNLRTILGRDSIDVVALDVKSIDLDWPPRLCPKE